MDKEEYHNRFLNEITPLILTYNETENIGRTLSYLSDFKEVIIIDSHSSDNTLNIIQEFSNCLVYKRNFDNHTNQWNFGLEKVNTKWVLSMDADYVIPKSLLEEITNLKEKEPVNGYFIPFKYLVFGQPLSGTILPPRLALFKKEHAIYIDDGHTQLLEITGKSEGLKNAIHHDDRKPLSRWLWAQDRYMILETKKLNNSENQVLSFSDKIRKQIIFSPFIIFFYCLLVKGGILDGWRGWYYAFQRSFAEMLLSIRLIENKFNGKY